MSSIYKRKRNGKEDGYVMYSTYAFDPLKNKKRYFSIKVWSFDQAYKKCQNRDFSIFDLIFENLPINLDGAMIPQKKWQTFLYQNVPQPAQ